MDKLILENQIAIMKALDVLLFLAPHQTSVGWLREALLTRVDLTEAALEVWRPGPAAVLSDLPAGMRLDGKPVDWRQEGY